MCNNGTARAKESLLCRVDSQKVKFVTKNVNFNSKTLFFSLLWFLFTVAATVLIMVALLTPHWLISSNPSQMVSGNITVQRYPSFGLSSRCKMMSSGAFDCATFSLSTSTKIFPFFWKLSSCMMMLSLIVLSMTCLLTMLSFCRQAILGKSLHTITGSFQILSGIFAMIATFLYPLGWTSDRITSVCIDMSAFHPGDCSLGYSFYSSVIGIGVAMICGLLSLKAEKASLDPTIKRRIEEGNERLVFAP